MDKIFCKLCGSEEYKKSFSQHLKVYHNKMHYDYVCEHPLDFPNWKPCHVCKKLTDKKTCCCRECDVIRRKGMTGERSVRFGSKLSQETKLKIGVSNKKKNVERGHGPWLGKKHSLKTREKISKSRISNGSARGEKNPMYGKTHTPEAIEKIFSHKKMNKFERSVATILTQYGVKYTFQYFINESGICKSYDFKIENAPFIIECDGDFWHGNPSAKHHWKDVSTVRKNDILKEEIAAERGFTIIRIWESELKSNAMIFIDKLKAYNLI